MCSVVRFLERFDNCEMEWTQESVLEFIELCKKKNNMGPKARNTL
jgi:hypothetical protein